MLEVKTIGQWPKQAEVYHFAKTGVQGLNDWSRDHNQVLGLETKNKTNNVPNIC